MTCSAVAQHSPRQVCVDYADTRTSSVAGPEQSTIVADTAITVEAVVDTQEMVQGDSEYPMTCFACQSLLAKISDALSHFSPPCQSHPLGAF